MPFLQPVHKALVLSFALLGAACAAQTAAAQSPGDPLATINGQPIYEDDLASASQAQLLQLRKQEYDARLRILEGVINRRLVEAEAKVKGLTPDKLLAEEADSKVADPTDGEVEAYYLGQRDRINRPLDAVKAQLRQNLQQVRIQQAREEFYRRLREKADVAILLRPPKTEVAIDPARLRGNPGAPVTIVEFSDFQCPYCLRAQAALQEVMAKYQGRVRLGYRDFPLDQIHPRAHKAAEASRCAGEQGKFWEYHDILYADNAKLSDTDLLAHAKTLALEQKKFEACLTSGKYAAAIEKDTQEGANAGVTGTPAFFVNGVLLSGAQPFSAFAGVIDAELASIRLKPAGE